MDRSQEPACVAMQADLDSIPEGETLELAPREYPGPLVLRRPIVVDGHGATFWALSGPVLSIECDGVTLRNLRVEVTGDPEGGAPDEDCALRVSSGCDVYLENVDVRGSVLGMDDENGAWRYPKSLYLDQVAHDRPHVRVARIVVGAPCRITSEISGLEVEPKKIAAPGPVEIQLRIDRLSQDTLLHGRILLSTAFLRRWIVVGAHAVGIQEAPPSADGTVVWEAPHWGAAAASPPASPLANIPAPAPPPVVQPPAAPPTPPPPAPATGPAPPIPIPIPASNPPAPSAASPPPVPLPTPPVVQNNPPELTDAERRAARRRVTSTSLGTAFGSGSTPLDESAAPSNETVPPAVEMNPPASSTTVPSDASQHSAPNLPPPAAPVLSGATPVKKKSSKPVLPGALFTTGSAPIAPASPPANPAPSTNASSAPIGNADSESVPPPRLTTPSVKLKPASSLFGPMPPADTPPSVAPEEPSATETSDSPTRKKVNVRPVSSLFNRPAPKDNPEDSPPPSS